ncbi:MAG: MarR family transcriptional regulator [Chloroflexi bacterium]|nr:MarR family transcriptional regulator [Chloroflexota bacterium]
MRSAVGEDLAPGAVPDDDVFQGDGGAEGDMALDAARRALPAAKLHTLARALARTATHHALFSQAVAAQLGIGATDLEGLALLYDLGPATPGALASALGVTTGAITGLVDRLAAVGFVQREGDPSDRRRVLVHPLAERYPEFELAMAPLREAIAGAFQASSATDPEPIISFNEHLAGRIGVETRRIRGEQVLPTTGSSYTAPLGDLDAAILEFANGTFGLHLGALDASGDAELATALYTASFEGPQPTMRFQSGTLSFRYRRIGPLEWGRARHSGRLALNPGIPWTISARGGVSRSELQLTSVPIRDVRLSGGVDRVDLYLPHPTGTVDVRLEGGVSRVHIQRPPGVAAQLIVHGGANRLEFGQHHFGAVGGEMRLATPEWELAPNRYAIEVRGGASRLAVFELQEGWTRAHDAW